MTTKKTKKKKPLTHGELVKLLRGRFTAPEWVTLTEVQPECGFMAKTRRTDMLGISTFPSRGLRMAGFELKSSRADVLKELREPEKALAMQRYCHLWYLVVGRSDLCGVDELPPNWGLIVPHGNGLQVKVNAKVLEPEPWPATLTHMLIRKAFGNSIEDVERDEIHREAYKKARTSSEYERKEAAELRANVDLFQKVSGLTISAWVRDDVVRDQAALLKTVLADGLDGHRDRARRLAQQLEQVGAQLRTALGDA